MRKFEFSKIILLIVAIATVLVVVASFVLMWRTMDLSPLSYIITGIFAELASATGFYYWKAKNENMIKLGQPMQIETNDDNLKLLDLNELEGGANG